MLCNNLHLSKYYVWNAISGDFELIYAINCNNYERYYHKMHILHLDLKIKFHGKIIISCHNMYTINHQIKISDKNNLSSKKYQIW